MRSATVKPGSTLSKTGSLTMTIRRQRNQATAERARVRLQCLHQVCMTHCGEPVVYMDCLHIYVLHANQVRLQLQCW